MQTTLSRLGTILTHDLVEMGIIDGGKHVRKPRYREISPNSGKQNIVGFNRASFCAHPRSKTITLGSNGKGLEIAHTRAENQHDSEPSYSVVKASAATVNRRVASSSLARGAKSSQSQ